MSNSSTTPSVHHAEIERFSESLCEVLNAGALSLAISLGHRTELFDTLSRLPPATSQEIAAAAGLDERYTREWLGAMVTARVVRFDDAKRNYHLPPAHAASLTRSAGAMNVARVAQFLPVMAQVEDGIVEAFHQGGGVGYECFPRFHEVMAEDSAHTIVSALRGEILPLVDGLHEQLEAGIDVLDVGCGSGSAMVHLAEAYPRSRFAGYDFSPEAIERATAAAVSLSNVRFERRDATKLSEVCAFDLVASFDAIHDSSDPAALLAGVRRALRPSGVYLAQDIRASSHLDKNREHPFGTFLYTISLMHCMTVSLAEGGVGLGTMWGEELALEMFAAAGFRKVAVRQLEHDLMNNYYVAEVGEDV